MPTIAAIASARSISGVGVIRVSGPKALEIAERLCHCRPKARQVQLVTFSNQAEESIDQGLLLYFQAPNSFTGEDVVEFQCHGGVLVMDMLLEACLQLGARLANPGEFSQRAFINDRIDLCQAEAIADLINASSAQAVRAANQTLRGVFSNYINSIVESLTKLRVYVEAAIDFPEEEVDFLDDKSLEERLDSIQGQLQQLLQEAQQGALLIEGNQLVIAGRPNAGKSSLLNCLAGDEVALVTDIAGTTRDAIPACITIDGLPLHFLDTAGLQSPSDSIEALGIERTWQKIAQADQLLYVIDGSQQQEGEYLDEALLQQLEAQLMEGAKTTLVINKIDLMGVAARVEQRQQLTLVYVSALEGDGIDLLKQQLKNSMGYQQQASFSSRARHSEALRKALTSVEEGQRQLRQYRNGEFLAEELKQAQHHLGSITGKLTADDLLGHIFSSFCIGK